MNKEQELKQRAAQLRQPHGEAGIKTAEWMNKGNLQINRDTLAVLDAQPNDNILEIGMGNGFFVKEILSKDESIHYTGCDFSELMIAESTKINAEWIAKGQAKFILSKVATLPFPDNTFNKIFNINTIYFWDDEKAVLKEIKRVLKPNGKFITALRPKYQAEKYPFTKYGFNLFSKEDVIKLLSDNGFIVTETIENHEPDFEVNGEKMKMDNLIVVASKK